jgi:hypothetical protein
VELEAGTHWVALLTYQQGFFRQNSQGAFLSVT